ncbi:MAG: hypothetical protein AB1458_07135 [Bacteroidota bacterium]
MKKISAFFLLLLFGIPLFAGKLKVSESKEKIGGGSNNALVITIYEVAPDEIEKEFKSRMKDFDAKVSSKDDGLFGDNAVIKDMGNNTVDIYAKVEKVKDGEARLIVAFDLGGAFLNSSDHKDKYKVAEKIVYDFAIKITKGAIAAQLKAEEKKLEKLTDEQKDLVKKNENLAEDIKEYEQKIAKAKEDIEKNKQEQEKKKSEIEVQKKVVEEVTKKQNAVE